MDHTEEFLRSMPPRELDLVFAEVICGLHILHKNLFGVPGFVFGFFAPPLEYPQRSIFEAAGK
jgi:hypothetical protein